MGVLKILFYKSILFLYHKSCSPRRGIYLACQSPSFTLDSSPTTVPPSFPNTSSFLKRVSKSNHGGFDLVGSWPWASAILIDLYSAEFIHFTHTFNQPIPRLKTLLTYETLHTRPCISLDKHSLGPPTNGTRVSTGIIQLSAPRTWSQEMCIYKYNKRGQL